MAGIIIGDRVRLDWIGFVEFEYGIIIGFCTSVAGESSYKIEYFNDKLFTDYFTFNQCKLANKIEELLYF